MKKLLIHLALIGTSYDVMAQDQGIGNSFSIGLQIGQLQSDFGGGINITSPYFANDRMAVRARGNYMFYQHVDGLETIWSGYQNASLGLIGKAGTLADIVRLYGEGGVIGLFPSNQFSSEGFEIGGYGILGFEFFIDNTKNYFIEIGGVGTGAKADRILYDPIYSNGLLIFTGIRFFL